MYPTSDSNNRNHRSNARRVPLVAAGLVATAILIVGCATAATQSGDDTPDTAGDTINTVVPTGVADQLASGSATPGSVPTATGDQGAPASDDTIQPADAEPTEPSEPTDADEDALDQNDNSDENPDPEPPQPQPDPGDGEGDGDAELEPNDDTDNPPAEPHPCDSLVADGSSLVVGPDPLVLESGTYEGSIHIVNCSDGDIDWTAKTKPSVTLDDDAANLLPGENAKVDFVIDKDAWEPGAIEFKIKISEPGHNHYVDVHAYRPLTGADMTADVGLTAGDEAGGCANQCIVSAVLKPAYSTADLAIDITTNTAATIRTYVSKQAPVEQDGHPVFPGKQPIDVSPAGVTNHLGHLSPLDAATKYYIIVSATDSNDNTSYRSGSFVTVTPVDGPGDFQLPGDPPGCAADCITKALITPTGDTPHTMRHLSVETHTAAQLQVFVSTQAPAWNGNVPSFADTDVWQASGLEYVTSWDTDLTGLTPGTQYHVIVQAIDINGHVDRRVGTFSTPAAPTVDLVFSVVGIEVTDDADKGINRGEISLAWSVGGEFAGYRDEHKVSSGDWTSFPADQSVWIVNNVSEDAFLPTVHVKASERDPDAKIEFCSSGLGISGNTEYGHDDSCDWRWSLASSGLVTVDSVNGYDRCSDLGFDVDPSMRCMQLVTSDVPGGHPEFVAWVGVIVVG